MEIFSNFKALTLVVFFFGASIFVHELGHFLAARWRGLKVTRFSIGFGPKLFSWTRDGVEYIVAALPIGGYVALPQLGHMEIIEGEADQTETTEVSWSSKVIVLVAGALFNVIFALCIASVLFFIGGRPVMEANETTQIGSVAEHFQDADNEAVENPAFSAGLRMGDVIKAIDGEPVNKWESVELKVIMGSGRTPQGQPLSTFTIDRNGEILNIQFNPIIGGEEKVRQALISPAMPAIVGAVSENSPALLSGLKPGDEFEEMDTIPIFTFHQVSDYIQENPEKEITFKILRGGESITKAIKPISVKVNSEGEMSPMIGIMWSARMTMERESPIAQVKNVVGLTFATLEKLINPNSDIKFSDIYPLKVNNGACLFIQHCVFMLNENGFCAIVLPDGELFEGNSKWSKTFRKWWCTNVNIRTILKVASGTFEHAGVKTNVVIFTKDGSTQNIKFMETSKECNKVTELFTITQNDL